MSLLQRPVAMSQRCVSVGVQGTRWVSVCALVTRPSDTSQSAERTCRHLRLDSVATTQPRAARSSMSISEALLSRQCTS